jgi:hypothetical protein
MSVGRHLNNQDAYRNTVGHTLLINHKNMMCVERHLVRNKTPYKCDVSGKTLGRKAHMQAHMKTHMGDKTYKCDEGIRSEGAHW